MSKHDAVKAYFVSKVKELAGSMLNFNFSPESPNSISLLTNYSDKVRKKYITGDALKEYGFSIIIVKEYSSESDDLNLEAMNFAQTFMEWLEEQNEKKEYPDFGENCTIEKMENLQNMPNLSGVNYEAGLARYMIQVRIIYTENE
ncbi:hypothetical protein DW776_00655 [Ruminococcus sp. AM30-15AC]|nr:hypothetical protein DWV90_00800 [Ruminococcus sp. AF13-37]RGW24876.1 hypothetical protein DWV87_00650 [Ruminococcus sp. AF13-28]RHD97203.1 hypothetical protein DW776_00655 [Ruminococcus sp. AM30-15AC]DAU97164.1 MAG TPA: Minor capsid protein from bacteriophage [Caudoviricetes sp.]